MRSLLVCVRTAVTAQRISAYAVQLGAASSVRTALSSEEALSRLQERPADVIIVDTAMARPDYAQLARRLLSRSPQAALMLVGAEDP
ncbi:MAG: helix-turn-helix transcriptional regulator, partial [Micromonosporaceae bacterium]